MRNMRLCMVLAAAACLTSSAVAWEAIAWGGSGTGWVSTSSNGIEIKQPGTYKFYATTGGSGGDLDEIRQISVSPDISAGLVKVSIVRDPTTTVDHDPNGCTVLGGIDLSNASDSEIPECRVQTNAATITGLTFVKLSGPLTVAGNIEHAVTMTTLGGNVTCASLGDFTAAGYAGAPQITVTGDYAGTMTIGGTGTVQIAALTLGSLSGSVTLHHVGAGGVTINGDVSGSLRVRGNSGASEIVGNITSTGSVLFELGITDHLYIGTPTAGRDIDGTLEVRGDITGTPRELRCFGSVNGTLTTGPTQGSSNMLFNIQIDKDVLGVIDVRETLHPQNGFGSLRVLGSLGGPGSPNVPGFINVDGILIQAPYTAYVCINYDGDGRHAGGVEDRWYSGSKVTVGTTEHSVPNDAARVHGEPPACGLGDVNGTGDVTFADIDPFVALLGFSVTDFPGRAPAVLFRADPTCDGAVTFADIDPFVAQLGNSDVDDDPNNPCEHCSEGEGRLGGGAQLASAASSGGTSDGGSTDGAVAAHSPQTVASYLAANVSATNYDALVDAVDYVATFPPVEPFTDWAQVAALLSGE